MVYDSQRAENSRDYRDSRSRDPGAGRCPPKDMNRGNGSGWHPPSLPKKPVERSQTWGGPTSDHAPGPTRDRPVPDHGHGSVPATSANATGLFSGRFPRPASGPDSAAEAANPPTAGPAAFSDATRRTLNLVCNMMGLLNQKKRAEEHCFKMQNDWEQHRNSRSDFPVGEHMQSSLKRAEEDVRKVNQNISETEEKLFPLMEGFQKASARGGIPNGATGASSCTCNHTSDKAETDARLASMEETLQRMQSGMDAFKQDSDRHKLEMEHKFLRQEKDKAAMAERYESQITQLSSQDEQQRQEIYKLRSDSDAMRAKVTELEQAVSRPPTNCTLAENNTSSIAHLEVWRNKMEGDKDTLSARAAQAESAVSQLTKTVSQLQKAAEKINSLSVSEGEDARKQVEEIKAGLASLRDEFSNLPMDKLKDLPSQLSKMKSEVQNRLQSMSSSWPPPHVRAEAQTRTPRPSPGGSPESVAQLEQRVERLESMTENWPTVRRVADAIGDLMDTHRNKINEEVSDLGSRISRLQTELAALESGLAAMTELRHQMARLEEKGKRQGDKVEATQTRLGQLEKPLRAELESIHHALQALAAWQSNFNTSGLYKDIVLYITQTLPNGVWKASQGLGVRIDVLEMEVRNLASKRRASEMEEDAANKRARLNV